MTAPGAAAAADAAAADATPHAAGRRGHPPLPTQACPRTRGGQGLPCLQAHTGRQADPRAEQKGSTRRRARAPEADRNSTRSMFMPTAFQISTRYRPTTCGAGQPSMGSGLAGAACRTAAPPLPPAPLPGRALLAPPLAASPCRGLPPALCTVHAPAAAPPPAHLDLLQVPAHLVVQLRKPVGHPAGAGRRAGQGRGRPAARLRGPPVARTSPQTASQQPAQLRLAPARRRPPACPCNPA